MLLLFALFSVCINVWRFIQSANQRVAQEYEFVYPSSTEHERIEPYIEFDSFEGSYSSNFLYGTKGLHICVDRNNQLSGSYDEIGLLQGFVVNTLNEEGTFDSTATGNFYEAGTGVCILYNFLQFLMCNHRKLRHWNL